MKRLFLTLAVLVIVWVLVSFLGVMFDPARAEIWTRSLMWSMLSTVILAPVFIFIGTSPSTASSESSTPSRSEQTFEVDENVDIGQQEEAADTEEWPYSS